MNAVMYSISVGHPEHHVRRAARAGATSPFNRVSTRRSFGSSSVSIHGPSGHEPSKPFARAHWSSVFCRSRRVTSFAHVNPRMYAVASSARTFARHAADHHRQLALVVDPLADRQELDRVAGSDHRRRRLQEQQRFLGDLHAELGRVRGVVLPHADDLRGQHGRQQPDVVERHLLPGRQRVLEERAAQHADHVLGPGVDGAGRDPIAVTEPEVTSATRLQHAASRRYADRRRRRTWRPT